MTLDYEQQYALKQHEERCRNYTESNKATVEFSKMALRGAFILNGSAAIGIIYAKAFYLDVTLVLFAIGALIAATASGVTYIVQYLTMLTWRHDLYKKPTDGYPASVRVAEKEVPRRARGFLHALAIIFVLAAYVAFACAVYEAYPHLAKQVPIYTAQ